MQSSAAPLHLGRNVVEKPFDHPRPSQPLASNPLVEQ